MIGLFWAAEFLNRHEGRQQGVAQVLDMPTWQYARLKVVMEKISRQEEVTVEQIQEILKQGQDNERK
jgi:predicted transcriptional regulator